MKAKAAYNYSEFPLFKDLNGPSPQLSIGSFSSQKSYQQDFDDSHIAGSDLDEPIDPLNFDESGQLLKSN